MPKYNIYGQRLKHRHTTRKALYLIASLLIFVVALAAATPSCQRLVKTQVVVPVKNTVSKATLAAWAAWRGAHPNWKQTKVRPKYRMTTQEAVQKVDFACAEIHMDTVDAAAPPTEIATLDPPKIEVPQMDFTQEVADTPTTETVTSLVTPQFVTATTPGIPSLPAPTPEPSSLFLLGTGLCVLGGLRKYRS